MNDTKEKIQVKLVRHKSKKIQKMYLKDINQPV